GTNQIRNKEIKIEVESQILILADLFVGDRRNSVEIFCYKLIWLNLVVAIVIFWLEE
ncbi:hypothetical protein A2U01_0101395, partial [Trifolium medium]|nr:hypothetical protein [Trifolium medium]